MNIGDRLGDYEIVGVLGTGGMGQVYKVHNAITGRFEAMKVLLPSMTGNQELAQRFLREIQVHAALDHPYIAQLRTAQQFGDQLVMIMELIEGATLEAMLQQGALPVDKSVDYASQVLDALEYAHARGVVHRDIKPANIMITPSGVVKLMDFGVARMATDQRLTKTGVAVGSLYYMSPEQIQGGEPDARSDLYALGVTLYEMVTGQRPFKGDSDFSIMAAHMQQTPAPPVAIAEGVPADLNDIILTAIARDPEARFQSAEAFRNALRSLTAPAAASTQATKQADGPPRPASLPPMLPPPPVPPPAPPSFVAPPAPPPFAAMAPAPQLKSRRGLYMALGSVVTVAVLILALIEAPKFRNAKASQNATEDAAPPAATAPADSAPAAPAAADAVSTPAPAASTPAASAPEGKASTPPAEADSAAATRPRPVQRPAIPPAQQQAQPIPAAAQAAPPAQVAPQAEPVTPPAPAQQPAPVPPPAQAAPQQPAPSSVAELKDLQRQWNLLAARAGAVDSSLGTMQQQLASQGLGLRGDMAAAQGRMDQAMRDASDAIRSGDAEEARANLQLAKGALEGLEKFLGR